MATEELSIADASHSGANGLRDVPRVIITDTRASYGVAKREILSAVEPRQHQGFNNRAKNFHQPTRQRDRVMRRFKSAGHAQRFLAAFAPIYEQSRARHRARSASDALLFGTRRRGSAKRHKQIAFNSGRSL
ncbi:MAG: hypothetical protein M5U01_21755 [Ardenticatenaceae bacterium]|nr:hypothetical protein [Ardenticatenaceae bacterium]